MQLRDLSATQLRSMQRRIDLEMRDRASLQNVPEDVLVECICPHLDVASRAHLFAALDVEVRFDKSSHTILARAHARCRWVLRIREAVPKLSNFIRNAEGRFRKYPMYVCMNWSPFSEGRFAVVAVLYRDRTFLRDEEIENSVEDLAAHAARLTAHGTVDAPGDIARRLDHSFYWTAQVLLGSGDFVPHAFKTVCGGVPEA